jgi:DNA invertase Pin-like site-specific DNA recombinase
MVLDRASGKIRSEHLDRQAIVYVRQSTLMQVREHTASTARQYDLARRAQQLGWPPERVRVIDSDQGRSGAAASARDGFQELIGEVGVGGVGAVLCLEASRLARACADWYRLLEICALARTLVIDEEGVYDPNQYNDRLLLGFKGTMSEAELHWLRQRLLGGKQEKAEQGALRLRLPVGYVHSSNGEVTLDPDEQVREAVVLLFALFQQLGTAHAVVRYFGGHGLLFPSRPVCMGAGNGVAWRLLRERRAVELLHNPVYAGAYAYGRTETRLTCAPESGGARRERTRALTPAEWPVLLQDHHPGYISWEQYVSNQRRLAENVNRGPRRGSGRGAPREGAALLQGLVRCGKCGEKMTVHYQGANIPHYTCSNARSQYAVRACHSMRGDGLDRAIGLLLLEAVQPAALSVALSALAEIEARAQQVERQWQLRRERARYEADLARRRFVAVDPENRLVARTLERDWNEALAAIERLEQEYRLRPQPERAPVSAAEREQILALARDLPALWEAPTTTAVERKQLLRCLVKEVTLSKEGRWILALVRWQTEAATELKVARPLRVWEARRPNPRMLERMRELTTTHTDRQMTERLQAEGFTTGTGLPLTPRLVTVIRSRARIASGCPEDPRILSGEQRGDGRWTTKAVAERLNIHRGTVHAWCKAGLLDGVQEGKGSPWWVQLSEETVAALRKPERQRRRRSTRTKTPRAGT